MSLMSDVDETLNAFGPAIVQCPECNGAGERYNPAWDKFDPDKHDPGEFARGNGPPSFHCLKCNGTGTVVAEWAKRLEIPQLIHQMIQREMELHQKYQHQKEPAWRV